jgi:hypothetical protein
MLDDLIAKFQNWTHPNGGTANADPSIVAVNVVVSLPSAYPSWYDVSFATTVSFTGALLVLRGVCAT